GEVLELREHPHLDQLAVLRFFQDGERGRAQLARKAAAAGRAAIAFPRIEHGIARSDVPDRGEKSGIGGEALARRNRRGAGQRAGRISRASKAQVEISLALQERDRLAGGIATYQNGSPIRQRRVPQLEGAAPVASQGPGGTEKLPRCSQRLLLVGAADREHQRLGVLWNGEERDAFLRVESVCFRGARVEYVESRASAER